MTKKELMLIAGLNVLYKGEDEIAQNRRFTSPLCHCSTGFFSQFLRKMNLITTGFQMSTFGFLTDSRPPYMNNYSNGSIKIIYSFNFSILPSFHILLHNSPKTLLMYKACLYFLLCCYIYIYI